MTGRGAALQSRSCPAWVAGARKGRCTGRGLPTPSRTPLRGVPLPSSRRRPGTCPNLSPPLLQYHTHGTPVSPGEGRSGNKGVFVPWLRGVGWGWESCSLALPGSPWTQGGLSATQARPESSASSTTPAPEVGARRPGHRGLLPGRRAGWGARHGAAAPGGHCYPRRDGERTWRLTAVEGAAERACARLRPEVRGGRPERSLGGSCPSRGGWNSLPVSCHPPPPPDRPHHRAGLPSPAVIALPLALLGTLLLNHPSGQTLMENFTPRWKNAGYERTTGSPEHLPRHHRHPF